jgi:hypothetical protein
MNAAEIKEQTKPRDARSVAASEVRTTDITSAIQWLQADAAAGNVEDNLVWLARTAGPATVEQVLGHWAPGGDREAHGWQALYVELSWLARGQLHKLSSYCGIAARDGREGEISQKTALRLRETEHRLQAVLSQLRKDHAIVVRGGGAMHLHDIDQPWQAHPDELIQPPATDTCAVCSEPIHYSNGQWRGEDGKHEVGVEVPCDRCASANARGRICDTCHGTRKRLQFSHAHTTEVPA